jgi:hypothetical protein
MHINQQETMVCSMIVALPPVPSNCYGPRASACLGILTAVPIFFFLYDAVVHRNQALPIIGSTTPRPVAPEVSAEPSKLSTNESADALIQTVSRLPPAKSEAVLNRSVAAKNFEITARSKRQSARIARGLVNAEGRLAYAQEPVFGFTPWGRP